MNENREQLHIRIKQMTNYYNLEIPKEIISHIIGFVNPSHPISMTIQNIQSAYYCDHYHDDSIETGYYYICNIMTFSEYFFKKLLGESYGNGNIDYNGHVIYPVTLNKSRWRLL